MKTYCENPGPSNDKAVLLDELQKQLEEATKNCEDAKANCENMKRIMARDISKASNFGVDKLLKKLVNFSDTLNICIQNKPDFESSEHKDNVHAKAAFDGIETSKNLFLKTLDELKISEFKPELGEIFDPMKHDAMFECDSPDGMNLPPKTIGVVVKTGWFHKEMLVRPSVVGVVRS